MAVHVDEPLKFDFSSSPSVGAPQHSFKTETLKYKRSKSEHATHKSKAGVLSEDGNVEPRWIRNYLPASVKRNEVLYLCQLTAACAILKTSEDTEMLSSGITKRFRII